MHKNFYLELNVLHAGASLPWRKRLSAAVTRTSNAGWMKQLKYLPTVLLRHSVWLEGCFKVVPSFRSHLHSFCSVQGGFVAVA